MRMWTCEVFLFIIASDFLHSIKRSIAVVRFEPVNLGLNGKCTNHYSTKATNNGVATVHMIWL
jgi:hypothetical protein